MVRKYAWRWALGARIWTLIRPTSTLELLLGGGEWQADHKCPTSARRANATTVGVRTLAVGSNPSIERPSRTLEPSPPLGPLPAEEARPHEITYASQGRVGDAEWFSPRLHGGGGD